MDNIFIELSHSNTGVFKKIADVTGLDIDVLINRVLLDALNNDISLKDIANKSFFSENSITESRNENVYRCEYFFERSLISEYPIRNYWTVVEADNEETANCLALKEVENRFPDNEYKVKSSVIEKIHKNFSL